MNASSSSVHSDIISRNDVSCVSIELWLLMLVAAAWAVNRLVGSLCDAHENIGRLLADFDRQYPRRDEDAIDVTRLRRAP